MHTKSLKGSRLSFQQARLWLFQQGRKTYQFQYTFMLGGILNKRVFLQSLQQVVEQHEILHTMFYAKPGMEIPIQVVAQEREIQCPVISLENLSDLSQMSQLEKWCEIAYEIAFDLRHGPVIRAFLLQYSRQAHMLLLAFPAICVDNTSVKNFIDELYQTYNAYLQEETLESDILQYADVSAWQEELLQEPDAEMHRAH